MNTSTIEGSIPAVVDETGEHLNIIERKVVAQVSEGSQQQAALEVNYFDNNGEPVEKIGTVADGTRLLFLISRNGERVFATSE